MKERWVVTNHFRKDLPFGFYQKSFKPFIHLICLME